MRAQQVLSYYLIQIPCVYASESVNYNMGLGSTFYEKKLPHQAPDLQ